MFKKIILGMCFSITYTGICAVNDYSLFQAIENKDVEGVKKILKNKPQLVNNSNPMGTQTPLDQVILYFINKGIDNSYVQILEELLKQKDLNVNKVLILPPIVGWLLASHSEFSLNKRYDMLMKIKDTLKLFFAYPTLDITVKIDPSLGSSTLNILENYKKIGIDKYHDLLRFFLDLDAANEKSWRAVLPKFIAMEDIGVMQQIYNKLKNQDWFIKDAYPLFEVVLNKTPEKLSQYEADSIIKKWGGNNDLYNKLGGDAKKKVDVVLAAYEYAKQHKLQKLGNYITQTIKTIAAIPLEDVSGVITSFKGIENKKVENKK